VCALLTSSRPVSAAAAVSIQLAVSIPWACADHAERERDRQEHHPGDRADTLSPPERTVEGAASCINRGDENARADDQQGEHHLRGDDDNRALCRGERPAGEVMTVVTVSSGQQRSQEAVSESGAQDRQSLSVWCGYGCARSVLKVTSSMRRLGTAACPQDPMSARIVAQPTLARGLDGPQNGEGIYRSPSGPPSRPGAGSGEVPGGSREGEATGAAMVRRERLADPGVRAAVGSPRRTSRHFRRVLISSSPWI
jgi:hypothetical protein